MKKIDFLLNWYYKENERRIALENSLNIPITILTALIAGIYFFVANHDYESNKILTLVFTLLIFLTIIFWIISIVYLINSYNNFFKGFSYKTFPNANFLDIEIKNVNDYYTEYKEELDKTKFKPVKQIENNISEFLKECIDYNCLNNDKKSNYLYKCKSYIIFCVISLFLSSIIFSYNKLQKKINNYEQKTTTSSKTATTKNSEAKPTTKINSRKQSSNEKKIGKNNCQE